MEGRSWEYHRGTGAGVLSSVLKPYVAVKEEQKTEKVRKDR